jgi:hypothetical protein
MLAGVSARRVGRPPKNVHPLDVHYQNLHRELESTFQTLGLVA